MKDRYAKINIAITIIASDNKKYMLFEKESRKNSFLS